MDQSDEMMLRKNIINKRLSQVYHNTQPFRNFLFNLDQRLHPQAYQTCQQQTQIQQSYYSKQYCSSQNEKKRPRTTYPTFLDDDPNHDLIFGEPSTPTTIGSNTYQHHFHQSGSHEDDFESKQEDEEDLLSNLDFEQDNMNRGIKRNYYQINEDDPLNTNKKICTGGITEEDWIGKSITQDAIPIEINSRMKASNWNEFDRRGKESFFSDLTVESEKHISIHEDLLLSDLIALENENKLNLGHNQLVEEAALSFIDDLLE